MSSLTTYYRRSVACTRATPACRRSFEGHPRSATPAITGSYSVPAYGAGNGVLKEASALAGLDNPVSTTPGLEKLLHDDHAPLRSRPGFFATMFAYAALAAVSAFGYAGKAEATPIDPLNDVPASSTRIAAAPVPGGIGTYIDAAGDVGRPDSYGLTTSGFICQFTAPNPTPTGCYNTGRTGAKALSFTPDGKLALGTNSDLYIGTISGGWSETGNVGLTGVSSNLAGLDLYGGNLLASFVSASDGTRKVNLNDGTSTFLFGGISPNIDFHEFTPGVYTANLLQTGNNFRKADANGVPFGSTLTTNLGNSFSIVDTAISENGGSRYMMVFQGPGVQVHNGSDFAFVANMRSSIPEPSTAGMMLLASAYFLASGGKHRKRK